MSDLRRHLLGIAGLGLIGLGLWLLLFTSVASAGQFATGALIRAGMLLLALWLALPSVVSLYRHFPPWVWMASGLVLLIAVIQGRIVVIAGAIFAVVVVLQLVGRLLRAPDSSGSKRPRRTASQGNARPSGRSSSERSS